MYVRLYDYSVGIICILESSTNNPPKEHTYFNVGVKRFFEKVTHMYVILFSIKSLSNKLNYIIKIEKQYSLKVSLEMSLP